MTHVDYFKLQAKNLFKDYKTKTSLLDERTGHSLYKYDPKYFDMDEVVCAFDIDEDNFSLMKAQHIIALMVGFDGWGELLNSSEDEQELAKLLFDNQHKIYIEDWFHYIASVQLENQIRFEPAAKLEIFKVVFRDVDGHETSFQDYRLNKSLA